MRPPALLQGIVLGCAFARLVGSVHRADGSGGYQQGAGGLMNTPWSVSCLCNYADTCVTIATCVTI
jgi:hypothetical protein